MAVQKIVAERPSVVFGALCFDSASRLAQGLKEAGVAAPVIALDTRSPLLGDRRRRNGLALFEIGQAPTAEAEAVVRHVLPAFAGAPFALVDDGSVYGRGLADAVREAAAAAGIQPALTANFRPLQTTQRALLRRLSRSGIEAVLIAASAEDLATIDKDLRALGLDWRVGTGSQIELLPFVEGGTQVRAGAIGVARRQAALPALEKVPSLEGQPETEAEVWSTLGFVAAQIADGVRRGEPLAGSTFDTALGPLRFGEEGRASAVPFAPLVWDGGALTAPAAQ